MDDLIKRVQANHFRTLAYRAELEEIAEHERKMSRWTRLSIYACMATMALYSALAGICMLIYRMGW